MTPPVVTTPTTPSHYADLSFEAIVEQSIAGVYVIQDERFVYVNATFAGFVGMSREEMTGASLRDIVPAYFIETSLSMVRRRISGEVPSVRYVSPAIHKAGHIVHLEVHGSRMEYRGRPAVVGVGIDVTERVQREEELRQARNDLQALAAHINQDREDQRAVFARELHDVLGGLLASIKMDVKRIVRRTSDPQLREITAGLMEVTQEAIRTVRDMSEELRPSGLDHLGLSATIARELKRYAARYDLKCRLDAPDGLPRIDATRATSIYRIFQEGMNNVAKHAHAHQVSVRLACRDGDLYLELADDGQGIGEGPARSDARGVLGMKERARELGGTLVLESSPSHGTRLRLQVPLHPEGPA